MRGPLALPSEADQRRTARDVIARSLSVRETESLVKKARGRTEPASDPAPPKPIDVHTRAAEERLRLALGTRVRIVRQTGRGQAGPGRIEIDFGSEDELIRIYEQLTDGSEAQGSRLAGLLGRSSVFETGPWGLSRPSTSS